MKKKLLAVLFGAVLVLGACGGGANNNDGNNNNGNNDVDNEVNNEENNNENEATDVSAAEEVYQNKCAGCHGDDLGGISGPELTKVGATYSAEEIADIIENGKGGMPAVRSEEHTSELQSRGQLVCRLLL